MMDPDAVWNLLCEKLRELNKNPDNTEAREQAGACLMILYRWLRHGGFPPKIPKEDV
jgi:hypothetical protein